MVGGAESVEAEAVEETSTPQVEDLEKIELPGGLIVEKLNKGTGPLVPRGAMVSVHYTGKLTDGTKFDSSHDRGQPIKFQVGLGQVIKGWDEGILQL